jgi:hypothetical protein
MSRTRHSDATISIVLRHKPTEKSNLEFGDVRASIRRCSFYMSCSPMTTESVSDARQLHEGAVTAVGIPRDRRYPGHANRLRSAVQTV